MDCGTDVGQRATKHLNVHNNNIMCLYSALLYKKHCPVYHHIWIDPLLESDDNDCNNLDKNSCW